MHNIHRNRTFLAFSVMAIILDNREIVVFAHGGESSRHIQRDQVLNDAGISTYCYCYWLTTLPKM
jgi:hypothetical protein